MSQNQNIGLLGQVLTVNATSNTITFNGPLVIANTIAANGSSNVGTLGYVLTSGGSSTNVYWAVASAGFTNGASIAVSNIAYTNTTGTSVGVAYSFINTASGSLDTVFS